MKSFRVFSYTRSSLISRKAFRGTRRAQLLVGTHRTHRKIDYAPAANLPLSAACRCASRPPSFPTVLPLRNLNPVRNGWVLLHFSVLQSNESKICASLISFLEFRLVAITWRANAHTLRQILSLGNDVFCLFDDRFNRFGQCGNGK